MMTWSTTPERDQSHRSHRPLRAVAIALGALLVAGVVTRLFWAIATSTWAEVSGPGPDSPADLLVMGLAALGAVLGAWIGLGFTAAALAALPGTVGVAAAAVADRLAPAAVRRTVAFLLGTALTATLAPGTAAAAADPSGHRTTTSQTRTSQTVTPAPDPGFRPTTRVVVAVPGPAFHPAPDPAFHPTVSTSTSAAERTAFTASAPATPRRPQSLGPLGRAPKAGTTVEEHVVVRRGDSLWDIAARHLGPDATSAEIAHEWPRWYAANRDLVGDDPDLLTPGQLLTPPTSGVTS